MMTRQRAALQAAILLIGPPVAAVTAVPAVGTAPFPGCNIGPTHHSHLIVPLSTSESACALPTAQFLLSHGATFFCPHTWDVKLLARVVEDDARATLCNSYFGAVDSDASPIHAFRPTFPQGGLPAEALGQVLTWQSPVIYHVHSFGNNPNGGPGNGWNVTTLRSSPTNVVLDNVLYARQFELQPAPAALTYLVHAPTKSGVIVLSHYISTAGPSGFDHVVLAKITRSGAAGIALPLRSTWALYLTFDAMADRSDNRLTPAGAVHMGRLHAYNETTMQPIAIPVEVSVTLDYYYGVADGFAGFDKICPPVGGPESPTMCLPGQ